MELFRPVGLAELRLIAKAQYRAFPPRLPEQPIFYPVLNQPYAEQIARDWNTVDAASDFAGFVTAFELPDEFVARYERRVVGGREHEELWVPADELPELNAKLLGPIRVVASFVGPGFQGALDPTTSLPVDLSRPEGAEVRRRGSLAGG